MARRMARAALVLQCCLLGAAGAPAEEAVSVADELLAEESAELVALEPARVSMAFEEADRRSVLKSSNSRLQIPGPVSFLSPYAADTASSPSATRGCTVRPSLSVPRPASSR